MSDNVQEKDALIHELQQRVTALEDELRYKLALTLTLANVAYDALLVLDQDLNVTAVNTAAEKLFRRSQPAKMPLAEFTGMPELAGIAEMAAEMDEETFEEQVTAGDRTYRVRATVIRRDGSHFIGLALQDVTQLVRLNRARRDMVANISHELRTPIANIRLIIDGLFHDQDKPKRKDSISSLLAIARETDALLWLVQEMADLSMIESGQAIVRMIEVPLVDVVNDAIERLANQSQVKNIKIIKHVPDKLHVLCDRDLTARVIINLLHNAIKWSPPGETIAVSALIRDDEVTISVFDNGPGVPSDQVERIFERFYQVDASRSGNDGTGLGLAICRHIVEAHGGRIWADSNANGAGGRFSFTLLSADVNQ